MSYSLAIQKIGSESSSTDVEHPKAPPKKQTLLSSRNFCALQGYMFLYPFLTHTWELLSLSLLTSWEYIHLPFF